MPPQLLFRIHEVSLENFCTRHRTALGQLWFLMLGVAYRIDGGFWTSCSTVRRRFSSWTGPVCTLRSLVSFQDLKF